jgi:hypothetical protein
MDGTRGDLALPSDLEEVGTRTSPFAIFEIDDFLGQDLYRALDEQFPGLDEHDYRTYRTGAKSFLDNLDPGFDAAIEARDAWRHLYRYFSSPETVSRLGALCSPHLAHRPARQRGTWALGQPPERRRGRLASMARRAGYRLPDALVALPHRIEAGLSSARSSSAPVRRRTPVYMGFEFSVLHDGSSIPPHTDEPGKLLSLMLYFPTPDQTTLPLGTEFYRPRPGRRTRRRWLSDMPDAGRAEEFFTDHEVFLQLDFAPRKLFGFVKSDVSWHGLREAEPGPAGRRALVVNYFLGGSGTASTAS